MCFFAARRSCIIRAVPVITVINDPEIAATRNATPTGVLHCQAKKWMVVSQLPGRIRYLSLLAWCRDIRPLAQYAESKCVRNCRILANYHWSSPWRRIPPLL